MSLKLTTHWSLGELSCRCGCKGHLAPNVFANLTRLAVSALEPLRLLRGQPIEATCGYRCKAHNAAVGGAPGSEHVVGIAADLATDDQIALAAKASQIPSVGAIGLYPGKGICHVDIRPRKPGNKITVWEQVNGQYIALRTETRAKLLAAGARDLA